jgi:hypothetical protein
MEKPSEVSVAKKRRNCYTCPVDEGRKCVLLIAASILAARKLAQYDAESVFLQPSPQFQTRSGGLRRSWLKLIDDGH